MSKFKAGAENGMLPDSSALFPAKSKHVTVGYNGACVNSRCDFEKARIEASKYVSETAHSSDVGVDIVG